MCSSVLGAILVSTIGVTPATVQAAEPAQPWAKLPVYLNISSPLAEGPDGTLYGTTMMGGLFKGGTIYQISPSGVYRIVRNFQRISVGGDRSLGGSNPWGQLVVLEDGSLVGTVREGGLYGHGLIYRLLRDGTYTVLHDFSATEGFQARQLIRTSAGEFWGVTENSVFRLRQNGEFTTMYVFPYDSPPMTADAAPPYSPTSVAEGSDGKIYGLTQMGGPITHEFFTTSHGVFFRVDGQDAITVLHEFGAEESHPLKLVPRAGGGFFGECENVVFQITESGAVTPVQQFQSSTSLSDVRGIISGTDGNLYGGAMSEGTFFGGGLFKIEDGNPFSTILEPSEDFRNALHSGPVEAHDGYLYDALASFKKGGVFRVKISEARNRPPMAREDRILAGNLRRGAGGSMAAVIAPLANDRDFDGGKLSILSVSTPAHGAAELDAATGRVTYRPAALPLVDDEFTYTVSDGQGATTTGHVSVRGAAGGFYAGTLAQSVGDPVAARVHVFPNRTLAGSLMMEGRVYKFSGSLDALGHYRKLIRRGAPHQEANFDIALVLSLIPTGDGYEISASVDSAHDYQGTLSAQ